MIISIGGASAIGKTTLSQSFSDSHLIIPEVNLLFENEKREGKFWYYEKQIERFQLAKNSDKVAILDGDAFQPIWYNWIYKYPNDFLSQAETHKFYLEKINVTQLAFPDLYIIFFYQLEDSQIQERK